MSDYILDGKRVDFHEVIKAAKLEGYEYSGIAFTSEASRVLRQNGHTVERVDDIKEKGATDERPPQNE